MAGDTTKCYFFVVPVKTGTYVFLISFSFQIQINEIEFLYFSWCRIKQSRNNSKMGADEIVFRPQKYLFEQKVG